MLKQRVITGVILALLVTLGIYFLNSFWFAHVSLVIIILLGGWEWGKLAQASEAERWIGLGLGLLLAEAMWFLQPPVWLIGSLGVIVWSVLLYHLFHYRQTTTYYQDNPHFFKILGFLVLLPAWYSLAKLHDLHYGDVFYLISLIAFADIGAYFTGKKLGSIKLAPELSPGKTREGMSGALILSFIWAYIGFWFQHLGFGQGLLWMLFSVLAVVISVAGDLFESMMKRQAGVKDSGRILPGHGGILDRIDSLLAAAPILTLGLVLMGAAGA